MNNKLTLTIGNTPHTFYLQSGFYKRTTTVCHFHKHYYTEIHIALDGEISYYMSKAAHTISSGEILSIPPNLPHSCIKINEGTKHFSVLIDIPTKNIIKESLSPDILREFFSEIEKAADSGNYAKVSSYLSLIFNTLFTEEPVAVDKIEDYAFIIEEFLKVNYARDVKLSDLAAELNLSETHTERLVKKYTGNTFRQELAEIRIKMAQMLLSSTDMTMAEISEYVGYNSYSGFYKAYKKNL